HFPLRLDFSTPRRAPSFSERATNHDLSDASILRLVQVVFRPPLVPHLREHVQRGALVRRPPRCTLVLEPMEHGVNAAVELDVRAVVALATEAQFVFVVVLAWAVLVALENLCLKSWPRSGRAQWDQDWSIARGSGPDRRTV